MNTYKKLLGEVEGKVIRGRREGLGERVWREEEEMLGREEIRRAIDKGKDNNAVGIDGVPSEVWKYAGEELKKWVWNLCNKIWEGKGRIEEWDRRLIVPIIKREREDK